MRATISIRLPSEKIDKIKVRSGGQGFSGAMSRLLKEYLSSDEASSATKKKTPQVQTTICIDIELMKNMNEVAEATGVTPATLIRLAVEKAEKDGTI